MTSVRNLIYYFRVVWDDRDYDYLFTHDLLLRKLKKRLKRYESKDYVFNQEGFITKPLRICVEILEREADDFYDHTTNQFKKTESGIVFVSERRQLETISILHAIMGKYSMYWWD